MGEFDISYGSDEYEACRHLGEHDKWKLLADQRTGEEQKRAQSIAELHYIKACEIFPGNLEVENFPDLVTPDTRVPVAIGAAAGQMIEVFPVPE